PNEKWLADLTYLRTWSGFCYLAFILDCFSRMIVGWQLATHMRTEVVLDAREMANGLREPARGLIAHRDHRSRPEHPLHQAARRARAETLDRNGRGCPGQRNGRGLGRDLQVRARRRTHLPQLRARRARGPQLDRLLQHGAAPRSNR